ncbi:MAG: TetR/AcrR family transcriptional regulator [Vulcanimicrobiaceae bacterium]
MNADASTATRILETAEGLLTCRGYNAFSYADIAKVVGISTASIHYHFPSKAELVRRLVSRYARDVEARLQAISRSRTSGRDRLGAYVALFRETLGDADRLCPCLFLLAEAGSVPAAVCGCVADFASLNEVWIARVLDDARLAGELSFASSATSEARAIFSTILGAALLARGCGEIARYDAVASRLLDSFT